MWTDGSRVWFTRWARREPNNDRGREDCTEIIFRGTNIISKLHNVFVVVVVVFFVLIQIVFMLFVCGTSIIFKCTLISSTSH